jgi:hypothetical protein
MHHLLPRRAGCIRIASISLLIMLVTCAPEMAVAQASPFMTGASSLQTRGRTLLAAAARVREAIPCAHVRAFALLRTMGLAPDIEKLLDPCRGEIRWRSGDAQRIP